MYISSETPLLYSGKFNLIYYLCFLMDRIRVVIWFWTCPICFAPSKICLPLLQHPCIILPLLPTPFWNAANTSRNIERERRSNISYNSYISTEMWFIFQLSYSSDYAFISSTYRFLIFYNNVCLPFICNIFIYTTIPLCCVSVCLSFIHSIFMQQFHYFLSTFYK